jgi:hypothetical protein
MVPVQVCCKLYQKKIDNHLDLSLHFTIDNASLDERIVVQSDNRLLFMLVGDRLQVDCRRNTTTKTDEGVVRWDHSSDGIIESSGGRLLIESLRRVDAGIYKCTGVGADSISLQLIVAGKLVVMTDSKSFLAPSLKIKIRGRYL